MFGRVLCKGEIDLKFKKIISVLLAVSMMLSVQATASALSWTVTYDYYEDDVPEDEVDFDDWWDFGWDSNLPKFSASLKPEITAAPAAEGIIFNNGRLPDPWRHIQQAEAKLE